MDPGEQHDERVQQAVAEVGDLEPAPHQQRAVRQRVVDVAGDHQPLADGALRHDRHHLRSGEAALGDRPQQPVLAVGEVVGQLLHDVAHAGQLDQLDDVAVETDHAVHVGQRPVLEPLVERKLGDPGVLRGPGNLDAHGRSLPDPRTTGV